MGWARIDDGFDDHPKVVALLDHETGGLAVGLWTLCLAWCHRNTRKPGKVPGLVPTALPRRYLGAVGREAAAALVEVGLWDAVDGGWMFHDFAEYLPSEETRVARAAAGRRGAAKRWQSDGNLPSGSHPPDGNHDGNADGKNGKPAVPDGGSASAGRPGDIAAVADPVSDQALDATSSSVDVSAEADGNLPSACHGDAGNAVANDGSRTRARRDPVPVPVTTKKTSPTKRSAPATDEDFERFWKEYPRREDKGHARTAWAQAVKKTDPDTIVAAAEAFAAQCTRNRTERRFIALPATWLRGERWSDEKPAAGSTEPGQPWMLPPSTAPLPLTPEETCPEHRGQRKGRCRGCRADALGGTP